MFWKPLLVVGMLLFVTLDGWRVLARELPGEAGESQTGRANTWSARSSTGRTLAGTWTAVEDAKTGAVTGTWAVVDPNGNAVVGGVWSAAKSPTAWTGAWRAVVNGSKAEYSGSWTAAVSSKVGPRFADLFEMAARSAVSGNWRAGRQSGTWSIRVASEKRLGAERGQSLGRTY